jgi:hypothetical protein
LQLHHSHLCVCHHMLCLSSYGESYCIREPFQCNLIATELIVSSKTLFSNIVTF